MAWVGGGMEREKKDNKLVFHVMPRRSRMFASAGVAVAASSPVLVSRDGTSGNAMSHSWRWCPVFFLHPIVEIAVVLHTSIVW